MTKFTVYIDISAFKKLAQFAAEPPEVCGAMKVRYYQSGFYGVLDFKKQEIERSGGHCIPIASVGWFGLWHTHPSGFHVASSIDSDTMLADLESSTKGDTPGFPPVHLIAAKAAKSDSAAYVARMSNDSIAVSTYFPTYKLEWRLERAEASKDLNVAMGLGVALRKHIASASSVGDIAQFVNDADGLRMFNFATIKVQKDEERGRHLVVDFYPLTRENAETADGVFIGASVPQHAVPVIIKFYMEKTGRNSLYAYFEAFGDLHGLYKIDINKAVPEILTGEVKVADLRFGVGNRLMRLRESGIDLLGMRGRKIALFGVGFIGTRVLARLSKLFDEITVVDFDYVGEENINYQELYTPDDVGAVKAVASVRRAIQSAPLARIYIIEDEIPVYPEPPSELVEDVIRWSDVVITTFDSFKPRLTVQLACNKLGKPLIDVGVGPNDADIRVWYKREKACIACYTTGAIAVPPRTVYASDPRIADLAADIVAVYVEKILLGKDVPTLTTVDTNLTIKTYDLPKNPECHICNFEVTTQIGVLKPWEKIGKALRLKRDKEILELKGDESASYLKYLEKNGYVLEASDPSAPEGSSHLF
jgi:molybdopterin/thiamine biosynthesis adenylyltransferase